MTGLNEEQATELARQAAREALKEFFIALGVDLTNPESLFKLQRDFSHLRSWREATDAVKGQSLRAAIWVVVTSGIGGLVLWFTHK